MPTTRPEIVYEPKYIDTMEFALALYPVWVVLTVYFTYQWYLTGPFDLQGFLAVVFGLMAVGLPFRVFREARFGDHIAVNRYLLPDLTIEYKDIIAYEKKLRLDARNKGISLYMITPDSHDEFEKIVQRLMSAREIKLKKK